jgi:hypothetical protein
MAAYMGRDVSKLKNKGGKWKYVGLPFVLLSSLRAVIRVVDIRVPHPNHRVGPGLQRSCAF